MLVPGHHEPQHVTGLDLPKSAVKVSSTTGSSIGVFSPYTSWRSTPKMSSV